MIKIYRIPILVCSACLIMLLSACVKQWGLSIIGKNDIGPIICLSSSRTCDRLGTEIHSIYVSEVDKEGNDVMIVWAIQGWSSKQSDYIITKLEYGVVPQGWKASKAAQPVKTDYYYSVNGQFFFIRDNHGKYHIYTRKEFFEKLQH